MVVTVTDEAGRPVPGATVDHWTYTGTSSAPELQQQAATGGDGSFTFQKSLERGLLVARKPGMAPAWMQLGRAYAPVENTNISLTLTPPVVLAGVVVNEDAKPVPDTDVVVATAARELLREDGAESSVNLSGAPAKECFSARTVQRPFPFRELACQRERSADGAVAGKGLERGGAGQIMASIRCPGRRDRRMSGWKLNRRESWRAGSS